MEQAKLKRDESQRQALKTKHITFKEEKNEACVCENDRVESPEKNILLENSSQLGDKCALNMLIAGVDNLKP